MKPYIYSTNPKITITNLKNNEFDNKTDISKIKQRMSQQKIFGKTADDPNFHYKFKTIKSSPYIIYHQGNYDILNKQIIGIVGPRAMSDYAKKILTKLFDFLKNYDIVTVSGLADGVDSLCHELSIKNNIPTIAVLGGGLGYFTKSRKREKMEKIIKNGGLILSEFKLKQEPTNYTFPQRNRIVAGLSDLLFVPEAGLKSGSLITINDGIKMNKQIFVAPNSIFEKNSQGIVKLLSQNKVKCRDGSEKFLKKYKFSKKSEGNIKKEISIKLSDNQNKILKEIIKNSSCSTTTLSQNIGLSTSELMMDLTMLEMDGIVYQESPGVYKRG